MVDVFRSVVLAFLIALAPACTRTSAIPTIAAASDLTFALEEIAETYQADTGRKVRLSFGSSGNFYTQISQGAPFQIFLSADEEFVRRLAEAGMTVDDGALYAIGRIVLFAPEGSPVEVDDGLAGLSQALDDGSLRRFAIANPEHAPYGRAAEEALRSQGLWDRLEPMLVLGENVSQAAQFATTGSAEAGVFAHSLALAPSIGGLGSYVLLPGEWHQPLRQRMVLIKGASAEARSFYAYIQQPAARAIFRRYGFALPDEAS